MPTTSLVRFAIRTAVLAAALALSMAPAGQADTKNPNINIGPADLGAKCQRSGGDWKIEKNGVYRCIVHNGDSTTVVECKSGKCEGDIIDNKRIVERRRLMVKRFGNATLVVNTRPQPDGR